MRSVVAADEGGFCVGVVVFLLAFFVSSRVIEMCQRAANFRIGRVGTAEIEIALGGTKKTVVTLNGTRAEARHDSPRP